MFFVPIFSAAALFLDPGIECHPRFSRVDREHQSKALGIAI
jgi:hypothetical protein